jgi:hypothetical protein
MSTNNVSVPNDAITAIELLSKHNDTLEMHKTFKGITLEQYVSVQEVTPGSITIQATNCKMCAALEGQVHLDSQQFPKTVVAYVRDLNYRKGRFVLSDFGYSDTDWKKRKHERVQPKIPIYVNLHWKRRSTRAAMDNISVGGMGIVAYKLFNYGMEIDTGSKIKLDFELPPDYKFVSVKATIAYLNEMSSELTRIGIQLHTTVKEAHILKKYVFQRKKEILEELNQSFNELIKPYGVENWYF